MPVATTPDLVTGAPSTKTSASKPSQKPTTKAERRELQEKQRAAKLLQGQAPGGAVPASGGSAVPPATPKPKQPSTPSQKKFPGEISGGGLGPRSSIQKDAVINFATGMDDGTGGKSRGLRIFSHFGLPKPVGHSLKGDIHPAIVRLGLLFSEFRICGSNARCIATLLAFKKVRSLFFGLSDKTS
jgi:translation initiation factor eIF-2B subunit delta